MPACRHLLGLAVISCLMASVQGGVAVDRDVENRKYDSEVTNRCPQPSEDVPIPNAHYYTHPKDCRKFVSCSYGLPHVMSCPDKTVFSEDVVSCVHEDGPLNRGIECPEKEKTEKLCEKDREALVPNPKACQRYYNCSDNSSRHYSFLEQFEDECDYPDLFDHISLRCMPWREARCVPGAEVGVEPCDYVKNLCVAAHCEPCYSRSPSCMGKPDGLNEHPSKLWTPHHVRCEANRSMEGLFCPRDPANSPFRMLFSPPLRHCVSVWEVSRENHGFAPACDKMAAEGYHVTAESDRVYFRCPGAKVFFCEEGEMFSAEEQKCIMVEPASTTMTSGDLTEKMTTKEVTEQPEEMTTDDVTEEMTTGESDVTTEGEDPETTEETRQTEEPY